MNIVYDVTDSKGNPLIIPTRPDQHVDYTCIDADVYAPLYLPDIKRDREGRGFSREKTYRESCLRFDLFNGLSKIDPRTTKYGFAINRKLFATFRSSPEFGSIRNATNADPLACYLAADELVRKLSDALAQRTKDAADAADRAAQAVEELRGMIDQYENDPDASLSDLERLKGELVVLLAELDAADEHLDIMLAMGDQSDALDRAIALVLVHVTETATNAATLASMAGNNAADLTLENIDPDTLRAADRLRRNSDFKKIVGIIGRVRNDLFHALMAKHRAGSGATVEVETGNDLSLVFPEELAALVDPALALLAEYNFARESMDQLAVENEEHASEGDAIVLVDSSGSMSGEPMSSAKAFALALSITLARARRTSHVAFFNTCVHSKYARTFRPSDFDGRGSTVNAISHIASVGAGGGTDINVALNYAAASCSKLDLQKPDVIVISDGYDSMNEDDRKQFVEFRKASGARLFAIFVGMSKDHAAATPLAKLSDKFWCEDDILKSLIDVGETIA